MGGNIGGRQHPVRIIAYTTKYFWLLSIPLIRGLISLQFDFRTWLEGAWLDISVVALILIFAFFRWYGIVFEFGQGSLFIRKGIFYKQAFELKYANISCVSVEKTFLLFPFNAAVISIDTNTGSKKNADIKLTVSQKILEACLSPLKKYAEDKTLKFTYYPKKRHLLFFSLVFSDTLSGVILISTLINQGGQIVGRKLELIFMDTFNTFAQKITFGLPPAAVALSAVIFGGWVLSFTLNLLRHWSFSAGRQGKNLVINSGFITRRTYFLNARHINYADFRQNLLTIVFKLSSVHVHCSGYGKGKRAIAVLIPLTTRSEAYGSLRMLLPSLPMPHTSVRPTVGQIRRYIFLPVIIILAIPLAALSVLILFPSWIDMVVFASVMLEIPAVWLLIVKLTSDFTTGIGISDSFFTLKYCHFYQFHTVLVPVDKICLVEIRQSIFQRSSNNCNLKIFTNAEKTKFHIVKYLPFDSTLELLEALNIRIYN